MTTALATAPSGAIVGRAQLSLTQIAEAWRRDSRGAQYVEALKTFLFGLRSPNTRDQYARSVNEFFEWAEQDQGRIPVPHEVTREKAIKYTEWLRNRTVGLEEHRLKKDSTRKLDLEIYRTVKTAPGIGIDKIRGYLLARPEFTTLAPRRPNAAAEVLDRVLKIEENDAEGLDRHLGCLVQRRLLTRYPSIDDIRSGRVSVPGIDLPRQAQIQFRVPETIFTYKIYTHDEPTGASRASAVRTRVLALKSFWTYMIRSGENAGGMREPLLKYNIWDTVTAQAAREARSQQEVSRTLKTPDMEIFNRVLGTTYHMTEDGTLLASRELGDVRDRAILFFLLYLAGRADELVSLQRGDVVWANEPFVSILGKGQKKRLLRVPDPAYQAILDLTATLEELADRAERSDSKHPARLRQLLAPEAPLFPATPRWGCMAEVVASGINSRTLGSMLHHRAELAGFARGTHEFRKVHPHGFRHLAAQLARDAGTPLPVIQKVLGHSNLSVTSLYTEVRDPRSAILFGWTPPQVLGPAPVPPGAPVPAAVHRAAPVAQPVPVPVPVRRPPAPTAAPTVIETVGVPVPEPELIRPSAPPVDPTPPPPPGPPKEERLIAIGEPPIPAAEREVATKLDRIYVDDWGEPGRGEQLRSGKKDASDEAYDTLVRTTAGRQSGLVWWSGPTGKLKLRLPVISPGQVVGEETPYGSVREKLADIWTHWMELEDERGPTAAFALLGWVRDALEVTYDVETEVDARQGEWVPYLAPLESTSRWIPGKRRVFREQRDDKIADWFHEMAWQHRISRGRTATGGRPPRVVDTVLEIPSWYRLTDPIAELGDDDRRDLFDWLRVLTGRPPVDATPRYKGASRRDIGGLVGLMCTYDGNRAELRRAQQAGERETVRDLKEALEADREAVNLTVKKLRNVPFDIRAIVDARVQETRQKMQTEAMKKAAGDEEEPEGRDKRERNRKFYLRTVGELFGPEAAADDILGLFAFCNQEDAPLSGWLYPELLHIQGKTIAHSIEFKKRFARETGGAHSECVARRMARELWELRRSAKAAEATGENVPRLIQRPDEMLEWLHAMAFFKVPCPREMETELQSFMPDRSPVPLFEEWQRWRAQIEEKFVKERAAIRAVRAKEAERHTAVLEEFTDPQEAHRSAVQREARSREMEPNARQREYVYRANMRRLVPSPVVLLFCVYAR